MANTHRPSTRGRISRSSILEFALSIADNDGLGALTIRRLASDAAVTPMALYWHFRDKNLLLNAVAANIFERVDVSEQSSGHWDERLRALLFSYLSVLRTHPSVAETVSSRLLDSEAGLGLTEGVLMVLREAGFSREEAAGLAGYVLSATATLVLAEHVSIGGLSPQVGHATPRARKAALKALDEAQFPNIIASADALVHCEHVDVY